MKRILKYIYGLVFGVFISIIVLILLLFTIGFNSSNYNFIVVATILSFVAGFVLGVRFHWAPKEILSSIADIFG